MYLCALFTDSGNSAVDSQRILDWLNSCPTERETVWAHRRSGEVGRGASCGSRLDGQVPSGVARGDDSLMDLTIRQSQLRRSAYLIHMGALMNI